MLWQDLDRFVVSRHASLFSEKFGGCGSEETTKKPGSRNWPRRGKGWYDGLFGKDVLLNVRRRLLRCVLYAQSGAAERGAEEESESWCCAGKKPYRQRKFRSHVSSGRELCASTRMSACGSILAVGRSLKHWSILCFADGTCPE